MYMTLAAIIGRLLHLKRTCPKCKTEQIAPLTKKHEAIICKYCGTQIPPPSK